ncbi:unnamed protein product [Mytilus coruscus]|uniref:Neurotransmitter-gated ion-channel ligand-binding domain-containing protein n=1 Tax=Mytilus coruscus TaxID=42192 RepID=A0A6J8BJG1_MYTCO|nr:unnamed protein product [Mytilus coruscus]
MADNANVLLIGDRYVGKSTLVNYQRMGKFCEIVVNTTEIEVNTFILTIKDKRYKIIVKDCPGLVQDRTEYERFVIPQFTESAVVVFIYDKTHRGSFDRIIDIKQMVDDHVDTDKKNMYILVGNKSDDTNNVKVTTREGQSRCTKLKMDFYIETSAKEGTNVAELFQKIAFAVFNLWIVFQISWKDELLTWNKTNHNGFDNLIVSLQSVWKPDVIILNSLKEQKVLTNEGDDTNYVTINSDGMIEWRVYVNLKTQCKVRMKFYPFETQVCYIDVTKSYLDDRSVTLRIANISMDIERIDPNSEWEIFPMEATSHNFTQLERDLTGLRLKIEMKRVKKFYIWNFLMPSISLSIANCFTFVLPVKSNQKLSLCIFIFLANAVLIRLFNDSIPPVSETSYFGMLLWINLLLSGIGILLNIIITALYYCKSVKCISGCCGKVTNWFKCKCKKHHSSDKYLKRHTKSMETRTNDVPKSDEQLDRRKTTHHPDETTSKKYVKSREYTRTNSPTETTPEPDYLYGNDDLELEPISNTQRKNIPFVSEELPLIITHRDIKISMMDSEDTFIDHGATKIKLSAETSHDFQDEVTTWSDVTRNLDIIFTFLLVVTYACVHGVFLYALLNGKGIIPTL